MQGVKRGDGATDGAAEAGVAELRAALGEAGGEGEAGAAAGGEGGVGGDEGGAAEAGGEGDGADIEMAEAGWAEAAAAGEDAAAGD